MKRGSMIIALLMVVLFISTAVLASSKDDRDLKYMKEGPVVAVSSQPVPAFSDRKDTRDLSYLKTIGSSKESGQQVALQLGWKDTRDLGYLFENSQGALLPGSDNIILRCCQR
jgi:hypothetical protein